MFWCDKIVAMHDESTIFCLEYDPAFSIKRPSHRSTPSAPTQNALTLLLYNGELWIEIIRLSRLSIFRISGFQTTWIFWIFANIPELYELVVSVRGFSLCSSVPDFSDGL